MQEFHKFTFVGNSYLCVSFYRPFSHCLKFRMVSGFLDGLVSGFLDIGEWDDNKSLLISRLDIWHISWIS